MRQRSLELMIGLSRVVGAVAQRNPLPVAGLQAHRWIGLKAMRGQEVRRGEQARMTCNLGLMKRGCKQAYTLATLAL